MYIDIKYHKKILLRIFNFPFAKMIQLFVRLHQNMAFYLFAFAKYFHHFYEKPLLFF